MLANHHPSQLRRRLPRVLVGLVMCGHGIGFSVAAGMGLGPWDVLHEGLARMTGLPIGRVVILVGLAVLALWFPLRERPGLGTVLNVLVIGSTVDLTLAWLATPQALAGRVGLMILGPTMFGIGVGIYIGGGLGPGPRDGVMTGLARRGVPIGVARATIEVTVLAIGWLLGGTVGIGTIWFAATIGPLVHWSVRRFRLPDSPPRQPRTIQSDSHP